MRAAFFLAIVSSGLAAVGSHARPMQDIKKPAADKVNELHVIGIYEGFEKTGAQIHGPKALVSVNRPGKRVTLVLTSYSAMTWHIAPQMGTTIEKVVVGGYQRAAVTGLPANATIVEAFTGKSEAPLPYAYQINSVNFRKLVRQIAKHTEQSVASFQGTYRASAEMPFIVDSVQADPRLATDYPRPAPMAELPKLDFQAHYYAPDGGRLRKLDASYGDYSLAGPKRESLKPMPKDVQRIAYDPVTKKHFGIAGHRVVEVDLDKQKTVAMDLGLDVPPLSWPNEVAFDTKRQRLLLGDSRYIRAYMPATQKWVTLCERPRDLDAFAYSAKDDCLYGVASEYSENGKRALLCQLNADGAVLQRTPLGDPILPGSLATGPGVCTTQVAVAGDHVIILASPGGLRSDEGPDAWYIYLVDPKKGKVTLASKVAK